VGPDRGVLLVSGTKPGLQPYPAVYSKNITEYLTKSVGQAAGLDEHATDAQRDHGRRLYAELQVTPCSPRCSVWLLYGIQPKGARHSLTPGRCKSKAHQAEHLGIAGRRVLVSRKWSNKTPKRTVM